MIKLERHVNTHEPDSVAKQSYLASGAVGGEVERWNGGIVEVQRALISCETLFMSRLDFYSYSSSLHAFSSTWFNIRNLKIKPE